VVVSRSSSDPGRWPRRWLLGVLAGALTAVAAPGCVTVEPQNREYLADPAMRFGNQGTSGSHEQRVFSNREGSYGARGVSGGGCGCN
jgi:hypothetical protein